MRVRINLDTITDIGNFVVRGLMIAHLFAIFGLILLGMLGLFIWV